MISGTTAVPAASCSLEFDTDFVGGDLYSASGAWQREALRSVARQGCRRSIVGPASICHAPAHCFRRCCIIHPAPMRCTLRTHALLQAKTWSWPQCLMPTAARAAPAWRAAARGPLPRQASAPTRCQAPPGAASSRCAHALLREQGCCTSSAGEGIPRVPRALGVADGRQRAQRAGRAALLDKQSCVFPPTPCCVLPAHAQTVDGWTRTTDSLGVVTSGQLLSTGRRR